MVGHLIRKFNAAKVKFILHIDKLILHFFEKRLKLSAKSG